MADLFGLSAYRAAESDSDEEARRPAVSSDTSSSEEARTSSASSLDSAEQRARAAQARLRDYDSAPEAKPKAPQGLALPDPNAALDEVDGPPAFLDPEATRPVATAAAHGLGITYGASTAPSSAAAGTSATNVAGKNFDIARLAPPMKGQKRPGEEDNLPAGAVIEGKAKKYKQEDTVQYTDLQIAMMGGQVPTSKSAGAGPGAGPGKVGPAPPPTDKGAAVKAPSKPQDVAEFLAKGEGAALLPRKGQDRKDKEKQKRGKGQSSVHGWKSEAEMVLRQQFDS